MDSTDILILIVLSLGGVVPIIYLLVIKRKLDKIKHTVHNDDKKIVPSIVDDTIKATIDFNSHYEVFEWDGEFEDFHVLLKSWISYDYVEFSKEDSILGIKYYKDEEIDSVLAYLPYEVSLNTRHFYRSTLKNDREEFQLLEGQLKDYFQEGRPVDLNLFSPQTQETLDILIFAYFTHKRFISFLEKHYPDFVEEIRQYRGKPVSQILEVFKSTDRSIEELEMELKKSIHHEDFEKATLLRDQIKSLKSKK